MLESVPQPELGADGRILEGVVTTFNAAGVLNISPMGPLVGDAMDRLWLRPFRSSTTYQNLKRKGFGIFHVTDNVELIARTAIGQTTPGPKWRYDRGQNGAILEDACRWYAFEVESLDDSAERTTIVARVVDHGDQREFFGFNRAKHAVLEAAILATRLHILDPHEVLAEMDRLATLVAKTGGAAEHRAMSILRLHVERAATLAEIHAKADALLNK
jgi:hypothetical protein